VYSTKSFNDFVGICKDELGMTDTYLIWLDILGFQELAKDIANESSFDERKVREDFIRVLNEKVSNLEKNPECLGKSYGNRDDWLLVVSSLDFVFKAIKSILDHNTGYKNCKEIPLEIAIGVGQFDKWASFNGSELIVENSAIDFLKTKITSKYRHWYKITSGSTIETTFIVFTEHAYNNMEPFDKQFCSAIRENESQEQSENGDASFWVADTSRLIQRGTFLTFLEKIGKSQSSWYRRVDSIFIPPLEYQEIAESMETNHAVFLIGDPEIGKTYTAVRMLWEYYNKGYEPIWRPGAELEERRRSRQMLTAGSLTEKSITYFEDPFGKIKFENREELGRMIGCFLFNAKSSDVRAIVTSREEVFKRFEKEKLSQTDLRDLSVAMHLMKPTYDKNKMENMLVAWATEFDCKWLTDENLKKWAVERALKRISTPLGLKDFALTSKSLLDIGVLNLLIEEKSKEVKASFAEEIAKMEKEKVLFLSLAHILYLKPEEVKAIYERICLKFGLNLTAYSFSSIQQEFNHKVKTSFYDRKFEFTHPSYEEGVVAAWNRIEVKSLLIDSLNELVKDINPVARGSCGLIMVKDFADISFKDEAKRIINLVLHDKNVVTRAGVAAAIEHYSDELPIDIVIDCLDIMQKDRHRDNRSAAINAISRGLLIEFITTKLLIFFHKVLRIKQRV
jgi:hypothetical protein